MDELMRRRMMQKIEEPMFLDYIENGTGEPSTTNIELPSWNPSIDSLSIRASLCLLQTITKNTAILNLGNLVVAVWDYYYRLWDNISSADVSSNKRPNSGIWNDVYIAHNQPYQTKGFTLGVNNANWSRETDHYIGSTMRVIFVRNNHTEPYKIRYGRIMVSKNSIVEIDLRPCYYHGEYGLWDVISNTFYGNIMEGASFTGPAIE